MGQWTVFGYAGTIDAIAIKPDRPEDGIYLIDYKTGKKIYPETALQLTAYRKAFIQCGLVHVLGLGDSEYFTGDDYVRGVALKLPRTIDEKLEVREVASSNTIHEEALGAAIMIQAWKSGRYKWKKR